MMHRRIWTGVVVAIALALPAVSPAQDADPPRVLVVVVDGLEPEDVTPTLMPNLAGLALGSEGRSYELALANMITETNANHASMMTGAFGETTGLVANGFFDTRAGVERALDAPSLLLSPTLFDAIDAAKPELRTATVLGKAKLQSLFDCTASDGDPEACGPSTDNPEGVSVSHVRPDFHRGASEDFDIEEIAAGREAPAEPATGSGYTLDELVAVMVVRLLEEEDPHFTFVNFPGVDGLQHLFGAKSPGGRFAVASADASVGLIVESLRQSGKWARTVLIVTADHSFQGTGDPVGEPEGDPGLAVHNPATPHATGTVVPLDTLFASACPGGTFDVANHGGSASVYLGGFDGYAVPADAEDPFDAGQKSCLSSLRAAALGHDAVDEALYRLPVELDESDPEEPVALHLVRSAHPDWRVNHARAGELLITAKDHAWFVSSQASSDSVVTGNHGGPSARPIPFVVASGSAALAPGTDATNSVRPVDVAATVAWLFDVPPPADSEGRILTEAFPDGRP